MRHSVPFELADLLVDPTPDGAADGAPGGKDRTPVRCKDPVVSERCLVLAPVFRVDRPGRCAFSLEPEVRQQARRLPFDGPALGVARTTDISVGDTNASDPRAAVAMDPDVFVFRGKDAIPGLRETHHAKPSRTKRLTLRKRKPAASGPVAGRSGEPVTAQAEKKRPIVADADCQSAHISPMRVPAPDRSAPMTQTLAGMATEILTTADGRAKTALSHRHAATWRAARQAGGTGIEIGQADPPMRPARPDAPELRDPRDVPKRKPGSEAGRIAILHAVAHIELNAVDLHWDIIARFSHIPMPMGFFDDWVQAADEESKHFNLVCDCLESLGSHYGALPAHAGMWRAAEDTAEDLLGRLAVVPMVLEARGLDVTPGMIEIFRKAELPQAVAALQTIYAEEVHHVAYGSKWFNFLCGRHNKDPKEVFHDLVRHYFKGALKPPFNEEKRAEAGLPPDFYWPLSETIQTP